MTIHFPPSAEDHAAALAENANRSARFQPVGDGYDEPFIEVAGVKAFLEVDALGRYCIGVWDDSNGEHFTGPDGRTAIVVEVNGEQVWTNQDTGRCKGCRVDPLRSPAAAPVTRAGYCIGCAERACEQGDGQRVGLPVPVYVNAAVDLADEHAAVCPYDDPTTCRICGFATITCGECGLVTDEMTAEQREQHTLIDEWVAVGCEGYVQPNVRAAAALYAPPCTPVTVAGGQPRRFGLEFAFWLAFAAGLVAAAVADLGPRAWTAPLFVFSAVAAVTAGVLLWLDWRPRR